MASSGRKMMKFSELILLIYSENLQNFSRTRVNRGFQRFACFAVDSTEKSP